MGEQNRGQTDQFDANVSAIQIPDPKLMVPSLTESGIILNEAEGDLHDVKEMDHMHNYGFKSSFLTHHLATNPNVSAIPSAEHGMSIPNLPDNGPEVNFVSRVNSNDTVLAHVDTGATVMVSNVQGEIHGAVPTTAHCGTAMTGSKATIDALGTWMIELVGSNEGTDLPLAFVAPRRSRIFNADH